MNAFHILPQHVSANGCHLQGVVGAFKLHKQCLCVWACADYDPSRVASCDIRGIFLPVSKAVHSSDIHPKGTEGLTPLSYTLGQTKHVLILKSNLLS
jgi:hypothetical protein